MRKFSIKAKVWLLIFGLFLVGAITVTGNIFLAVNKDSIKKEVDGYFTHEVSIGRISYAFPNRFILKDIVIKNIGSSFRGSAFVLSKISIHFSVSDLLFNGFFNASDVILYPSEVSYYALNQFLEDNFQEILEIIRNSSDKDIRIHIKETLLDFDRMGKPDYVAMELYLTIRDDSMTGKGFFRTDQYQFPDQKGEKIRRVAKGWPLWYKLKGQLKADGFEIEHFILKSANIYSKLWGGIRSGLMKVKGFTFVSMAEQDPGEAEYSSSRYFEDFPQDDDLPNVDMHILDIDGRISLTFPDIKVEKFDFTLNNFPVTLKGNVSILDPLVLDADLSVYQTNPLKREDVFLKKADVSLSGVWKDGMLNTDVQAHIDFIERDGFSFSPDTAKVDLRNLSFYFDEYNRPNINLAGGDVIYWTNDNEHKISIKDFTAANTKIDEPETVEINALFYDGALNGRIRIDSSKIPPKITSFITWADADTNALEELLVHFGKFNGRMSSRMNFTNIPQFHLSGDIDIYDGQLTDFSFFDWVGDSFRLPALKAIDFGKASAQFSINKKHLQLRNIHLKTEDVHIGGHFDVDNTNLVSSKLSLALSKEFLYKSPKFKPILKIFEGDASHLGFDFRLSGNVDTMNFQWLPSEVKRKIQTRIPDFIERMIEKNIDEMIGAGLGESK